VGIALIWEKRTKGQEDILCPKAFCDYCGEVIEDAYKGLYVWTRGEEDLTGAESFNFHTIHKGACDRGLCRRLGVDSHALLTHELRDLPVFLARNMGLEVEHVGDREETE